MNNFHAGDIQGFAASIDTAQSIVITSHLFPDYDAVCSSLLLARTLRYNYPEKSIHVVLEDEPKSGVVDDDSSEITRTPVLQALRLYHADCVILTDTNRFDKVTRGEKAELLSFIAQYGIKTIVVDHHERKGEDEFAVRIQDPAIPAATQIVYQVCFQKLKLQRPANIEHITMLGIVDDSGLFTYQYDNYLDTFQVINELLERGASIERAATVMNQLDIAQMAVIGELANNMQVEVEYAYSFIRDEFMQKKLDKCNPIDLKAACTAFGNRYVSAVSGRKWGFIVYPDPYKLNEEYRVSFRSRADSERDITAITHQLGSNGGHKHAAGANIKAANVQAALQKVKQAILLS